MLSTLLKLFRGQKYNTIRKRNDANLFEISELYLGVLGFTMVVFLLPTVAIFYFYCFISVILLKLALQVALVAMQTLLINFPYFLTAQTLWAPYALTNSVHLQVDFHENSCKARLRPVKGHLGPAFKNLATECKKLLISEIMPINIIKSVLSGQNLFYVMRRILNILARVD